MIRALLCVAVGFAAGVAWTNWRTVGAIVESFTTSGTRDSAETDWSQHAVG